MKSNGILANHLFFNQLCTMFTLIEMQHIQRALGAPEGPEDAQGMSAVLVNISHEFMMLTGDFWVALHKTRGSKEMIQVDLSLSALREHLELLKEDLREDTFRAFMGADADIKGAVATIKDTQEKFRVVLEQNKENQEHALALREAADKARFKFDMKQPKERA